MPGPCLKNQYWSTLMSHPLCTWSVTTIVACRPPWRGPGDPAFGHQPDHPGRGALRRPQEKWGPPRTTRMLAFYQEMFDVVPLADDETAAEYGYLHPGRRSSPGSPPARKAVAVTIDLEPDPARITVLLREQVGIDPNDPAIVLDLAAIGITNGTWRNSPLEDWHGEGRIYDGGMLRTNVATTKLVREVLSDHLGEIFDDEDAPLIATEHLADLEADSSDELLMTLFQRLSDPDRVLPDGRTLRQLADEDLGELVDHMDRALGGI